MVKDIPPKKRRRPTRGADFYMRLEQGQWSEERQITILNDSKIFYAIPYGSSSIAPVDPKEEDIYWNKLDNAGDDGIKRPDILVYKIKDKPAIEEKINQFGGLKELPFVKEPKMDVIIEKSILSIESENSLWKAKMMPNYKDNLRPMARLGGKPGLPKSAILPNVWIKDEDFGRLLKWQIKNKKLVHVWHNFYDLSIGISLNKARKLIDDGLIEPTEQKFTEANGSVTKKVAYKIYPHYTYEVGNTVQEPSLVAATITSPKGHIYPYVKFAGGRMKIANEALKVLKAL